MTLAMLSLSACHGVLDDLYDEPTEDVDIKEGQLYIDASSWTEWHYIDLKAVKDGVVKMGIPMEFPGEDSRDASQQLSNDKDGSSPPPSGAGGLYQ